MTPAALASIGVLVGIPLALCLCWAVAELTGDLPELGKVLSVDEWRARR